MSLVESIPLPVTGRAGYAPPVTPDVAPRKSRWTAPSINLAPLRYPRAVGADRPVRQIQLAEVHGVSGRKFLALATLAPELVPELPKLEVFGTAHGSGFDSSPLIARYQAVSEALERWAFFATRAAAPELGGFHIDPTTNGMAAFPGVWARQARSRALREAIERYALLSWWEGAGAARPIPAAAAEESAWQLGEPIEGHVAVLTCRDDAASGLRFYGHAAGRSIEEARDRARSEMVRHEIVIREFVGRHPDPRMAMAALRSNTERRAVFFALPEGQACFQERLRAGSWKTRRAPRKAIDKAILGPWSEYADVWRVVYEPPSQEFLSKRHDVFFW